MGDLTHGACNSTASAVITLNLKTLMNAMVRGHFLGLFPPPHLCVTPRLLKYQLTARSQEYLVTTAAFTPFNVNSSDSIRCPKQPGEHQVSSYLCLWGFTQLTPEMLTPTSCDEAVHGALMCFQKLLTSDPSPPHMHLKWALV